MVCRASSSAANSLSSQWIDHPMPDYDCDPPPSQVCDKCDMKSRRGCRLELSRDIQRREHRRGRGTSENAADEVEVRH